MNQTMYNISDLVYFLELNKSFYYNIIQNKLGIRIETFMLIPS